MRLFSFLLNRSSESLCGLASHLPFILTNPNPKYLRFIGFVTLLLVALTLSPSFLSIQDVTVCITLFAAALLLTVITQSSAYLTKCNPLACSSLSNSSSIMLLSKGERFPPCGVPIEVSSYLPLIIIPALRYFVTRDITSGSLTVLPTRYISLSCGTLSKNFSKSMSTIYVYPSFRYSSNLIMACCALLPGLNP